MQLNDLIDDADETPPDWDFADFIPGALKNVGIYDLKTHNVGVGSDVYGIPGLHSGSVIYFYRKDLFDAAGLQPAKTWDDFKASAQKLHSGDVAGCSFIGANDFSLATVDWYTRFITTGGKLMTGDPNGKDFTPHVDSPEGVGALQMLIDVLPYAPKNVTQYGFAENVDGFSTGKIAQMIFWSTIAGPMLDRRSPWSPTRPRPAACPAGPARRAARHPGRLGRGHSQERRPREEGRGLAGADLDHQQEDQHLRDREIPDRRQPHLGLRRSRADQEIPLSAGFGPGDRRARTPSRPRRSTSSSSSTT